MNRRSLLASLLTLPLMACVDPSMTISTKNIPAPKRGVPKHLRPITNETASILKQKKLDIHAPIFMRIFKGERKLEVWKRSSKGRYVLVRAYDICAFSGKLGPKIKTGDRQAPEGFYKVTPAQMNPGSQYHLSFNIGFPNAFDRAHGRTGSALMVHGDCTSAGCFAMTDYWIEDIYALAREAFNGGQKAFPIHIFPFRMTRENMTRFQKKEHYEFWTMLKEGYDLFEKTKIPPQVRVSEKRYIFRA